MKVHYLEIVSLDGHAVCLAFEAVHNVSFGEAEVPLGGAQTCTLSNGSMIRVRSPLRDTEEPIVRPYWLVEDIETVATKVKSQGAKIAAPPMEIPGEGKFAIVSGRL